jgi:aspartyl-tRNA(Asn)/glutamyl-tRNA(Gln) amidotransferase subunit C
MKLDVLHIAKLANLPINKQEEKLLESQLEETLSYIEILREVDTKNVQPTAHVTGLENITRDDVTTDSLTQEQTLLNSKQKYNGFFEVEAILDND